MSTLIDGIPLRDKIKAELSLTVGAMDLESIPELCIIQVGSHPASEVYVRNKMRFGAEIGVPVVLEQFPDTASEDDIIGLIIRANLNPQIGGIILQLPLPAGMDKEKIIESIEPSKDVDGLHSVNVKKLWSGDPSGFTPATTKGIIKLLDFYDIPLEGKSVLMIGRSNLVGKPTAIACLNRDATVTIAHHHSLDLDKLCHEADIIISATGVAGLISKKHIKGHHVIIDVGISREEGKLSGDADFEEIYEDVAGISPVPGGVGPLTVACLFQNVLRID